jgi:RNA polymerase sigma-70 factor (ECF subfamily)
MAPHLLQRVGPDDVVQSVCRTFVRRAREGAFHLADTSSLWRLLCAITLTKVRQHVRFHYRQGRDVRRELVRHDNPQEPSDGMEAWQADSDPTPAEAVAFADQMEQLLRDLGEEERCLVQLRLEGYTQEEIAAKIGCSERTVRRLLSRVRSQWKKLLDESLSEGTEGR